MSYKGDHIGIIISNNNIKRKIKLTSVYGVTVSNFGSEFVIHVPSEYDYRYQATENRQAILETLLEAYYKNNLKQMPFFFKEDFTLMAYTTTENDVKKNINRMP